MADHFQTVVDTGATIGEADHLARHVVAWLAEKGVVRPNPSEEGGYDRGPGAADIAQPAVVRREHETIPPVHFHLQVLIGRMSHSESLSESVQPGMSCPACGTPVNDALNENWEAATLEWTTGDDDAALRCEGCGKESSVTAWRYRNYAYGNLAFRFWNWPPLKPSFLDDVRRELGHPIMLVEGTL
jgi:hypothetical protein